MSYKEFNPSEKLEHIIDKYWFSDNSETESVSRVFPDCSMDILFNLGNSYFSKSHFKNNEIILTGMMTNFSDVYLNKGCRMFGVRFKPLGLNLFINFDFNAIKNDSVKINEIFPSYWTESFKNVFSFTTIEDIINNFEENIIRILTFNKRTIDNDVQLIISNINKYDDFSVQHAIKNVYTTQRQLEIKFRKEIGISIKEFININRFIKIKEEIKTSKFSLAEIAVENGYYDSSHFCKEIKKYTGYTAKKLK